MRLVAADVANMVLNVLRAQGDRDAIQWVIDHGSEFNRMCAPVAAAVNAQRYPWTQPDVTTPKAVQVPRLPAPGKPRSAPAWPSAPAPVKTGWRLAIRNRSTISNDQERGPLTVVRPTEKKPPGYNIIAEAKTSFDAQAIQRLARVTDLLGFLTFLRDVQLFTAEGAQIDEIKDRAIRLFGPLVTVLGSKHALDQAELGFAPGLVNHSTAPDDYHDTVMGIWLQLWNALTGLRLCVFVDHTAVAQLGVMIDAPYGLEVHELERVHAEEHVAVPRTISAYLDDKLRGPFRGWLNNEDDEDEEIEGSSRSDVTNSTAFQAIAAMLDQCYGFSGPFAFSGKEIRQQAEDEANAAGEDDPGAVERRYDTLALEKNQYATLAAFKDAAKDCFKHVSTVIGRQVLAMWSPIRAIDRETAPTAPRIGALFGHATKGHD